MSEPAGLKDAVAGSQTSAEASALRVPARAADDKDAAVGQERRGVIRAGLGERACRGERDAVAAGPTPPLEREDSAGVAGDLTDAASTDAADDEDAAIGQERRGVAGRVPRRASLTRLNVPVAGSQTSAEARTSIAPRATDDEDAAVGQERRRVARRVPRRASRPG